MTSNSKKTRFSTQELIKKFESAEAAISTTESIAQETEARVIETQHAIDQNLVEEIVIWRKDPNSFSERKNSFMVTKNIKQEFEYSLGQQFENLTIRVDWKVEVLSSADKQILERQLKILKDNSQSIFANSPSKNFTLSVEKNEEMVRVLLQWMLPLERVVEKHQAMKVAMALKARLEDAKTAVHFIHNKAVAEMSDVVGFAFEYMKAVPEKGTQANEEKKQQESLVTNSGYENIAPKDKGRGARWKRTTELNS